MSDHLEIAPVWLKMAREIQALAQTGLHYAQNDYDRQRYRRLACIAAEILETGFGLAAGELEHVLLRQVGYATPRVDVRAAVFKEDRLLLVRERMDGGWTLPGGWADVGDRPAEAAEREAWEEAGFRVRARKIIGVYDANRIAPLEIFHAYKVIFLCDLLGGEATTSAETSEVAFFALDELPDELSGERTRPRHMLDAFAAYADPDWAAVFD